MNQTPGITELDLKASRRAGKQDDGDGSGVNVKELLKFLRRRSGVILGVAFGAAALTFLIGVMQPAKYSATAIVMIAPQRDDDLMSGRQQSAVDPDSGFVDTQIEVIQSRPLIEQLVDRLGLVEDPIWNPTLRPPGFLEKTLSKLNLDIRGKPSRLQMRELAVNIAQSAIVARRKGMSYVLEITATSREPKQAALMANAIVQLYLETQLQRRFAAGQKTNEWLSERLASLKSEVQQKEAAIEAYRAQNGLLTAAGASLTEQQVSELQGSVTAARTDLAERSARLAQVQSLIRAGGSADSIAGVINSVTIRSLRVQEADVSRRQAELESRYGDAHPAVEKVRLERLGVERQIQAEIARIAENLKNEVDVARTRLAMLESNQRSIQGQLVSNNAESVKLRELERDAAATRVVYEAFLKRYQEVTETESFKTADAREVAEASPPLTPSGPGRGMLLLICAGLGLLAGLGGATLVEVLDEGISGAGDAQRKVGRAALASVPLLATADLKNLQEQDQHPAGYLLDKPMSAFAEGLRSLRTALLYTTRDQQSKIICLTSAMPNEGKTTMSLCLARIAAMAGQKVLLVDCDLRRRSLNKLLDIEPSIGLLEVVTGEAQWRSAIVKDLGTGLDVLPSAESFFNPRDIFGSERMQQLIDQLRANYDLVILDSPPVLAVAEARVISRIADQTIIVARWNKTPARMVRSAIEQLEGSGAFVAGVALNFVNPKAHGRLSHSDTAFQAKYATRYYAS